MPLNLDKHRVVAVFNPPLPLKSRKLFDYYTTPELNENFGKIEYEDEQEISDWIDIGQYMDYLLSSL